MDLEGGRSKIYAEEASLAQSIEPERRWLYSRMMDEVSGVEKGFSQLT